MTPAEVLRQGATLIEEAGHWREGDGSSAGRHCAVTAMIAVGGLELYPRLEATSALARRVLDGPAEEREYSLFDWNDQSPTDVVLATMRSVADELVAQ